MNWASLRSEFPATEKWAFFDHAATSPMPSRAARALIEYALDISENGSTAVGRWMHRLEDTRHAIARLINCDPLDLALVKNTSEGVGMVAEGFPWHDGDNLVLAAEEYPANQYPWLNLASRGITVRSVPSRGSRVLIDDLRGAIDSRTRLLALSSVEFSSGYRNDLAALSSLAQERGIAFFVDAIQSLGALPLDLAQLPIDFLACGGQKWLLGPQGTAFLFVRRRWLDRLRPIGVGALSVVDPFNFSHIDFTLKPNAGRWESGTFNLGGFAALGESVRLLNEAGPAAVEARIRELTDYVVEQAGRSGWATFSSRQDNEWSGIVIIENSAKDPKAIAARAKTDGIVVAVRGGRIRVSPHIYNTFEEIDRLAEILRE